MLLIIAVAGFLLNYYTRLGQIVDPKAVCIGNFTGCEALQTSPESQVLFGIPNSLLGIIFFMTITVYTIYTILSKTFNKVIHTVLSLLCVAASLFAIYLMIKQFQIDQYCPLCFVNAFCALLTSFLVITKKIELDFRDERASHFFIISILLLGIIGVVGIGNFYNQLNTQKGGLVGNLENDKEEIERILNLDNQPFLGVENAKLTIIEFGNPTCPYCKMMHEKSLYPLLTDYKGKVKYYYITVYSHCVNSEDFFAILESCKTLGKFFGCIEILYKHQDNYYTIDPRTDYCKIDFDKLTTILSELRIDKDEFDKIYKRIDKEKLGENAKILAKLLKIEGTPTLFFLIGGRMFSVGGYQSKEDLKALISKILKES
ncbi:MAG: thioredoxin domain-containing protein [Planctomycetota bacterium]